jgi:hypothetical protein
LKFERAFWGLERGFGGEGLYVAFTAFLLILTAEHFLESFSFSQVLSFEQAQHSQSYAISPSIVVVVVFFFPHHHLTHVQNKKTMQDGATLTCRLTKKREEIQTELGYYVDNHKADKSCSIRSGKSDTRAQVTFDSASF